MTRDAYVFPDHRTVVFWSRKSGCSSLAEWLARAIGLVDWDGDPDRHPRRKLKSDGYLWSNSTNVLTAIRRDGFQDFVLARNPFRRAVSIYVEKFVYRFHALDQPSLLKKFALRTYHDIVAAAPGGHADRSRPYGGVSFVQLLEHMVSRVESRSYRGEPDLNGHLNTQVPLSFEGRFQYGHVMKLEQVAEGIKPLAERLGCTAPFPRSRVNSIELKVVNEGDLSGVPAVEMLRAGIVPGPGALLHDRTKFLIRRAFAVDFGALGYDPEGTERTP